MSTKVTIEEAGVARTANPTVVLDGQKVRAGYDTLGRQIVTLYQVRGLISTAHATLATNAADNETQLIAGVADTFRDLVHVTGANESTNAISVELREVQGGGAVITLEIPAQSTYSESFTVPIPQSEAGNSWVVDFAANANISSPNDVTNTTVNISATFIDNI